MINYIVENEKSNYKDEINNIILSNKEDVFDFFNSPDLELSFNVYVYKDIDSLVKGLKERGFNNIPSYMCACQKDEYNSLNFFEPKDNHNRNEWSKE